MEGCLDMQLHSMYAIVYSILFYDNVIGRALDGRVLGDFKFTMLNNITMC